MREIIVQFSQICLQENCFKVNDKYVVREAILKKSSFISPSTRITMFFLLIVIGGWGERRWQRRASRDHNGGELRGEGNPGLFSSMNVHLVIWSYMAYMFFNTIRLHP